MGIFWNKEQAIGFTKQSNDLHCVSMKQITCVWKLLVKAYFIYLNYIYLPFSSSSVKIMPFWSRKKAFQRLDTDELHCRVSPEQRWSPLNPQLIHCLFKPIAREPQVICGHLRWNFCYLPQQKLFSFLLPWLISLEPFCVFSWQSSPSSIHKCRQLMPAAHEADTDTPLNSYTCLSLN